MDFGNISRKYNSLNYEIFHCYYYKTYNNNNDTSNCFAVEETETQKNGLVIEPHL